MAEANGVSKSKDADTWDGATDPRGGTAPMKGAAGGLMEATEMLVRNFSSPARSTGPPMENGEMGDVKGGLLDCDAVEQSPDEVDNNADPLNASAAADARLAREATTTSLVAYSAKEARKISLYRSLPFYLVFMICISLSWTLFESDHKHSYKYNVAHSTRSQLLLGNEFSSITSAADFYAWLEKLNPIFAPNSTDNATAERHAHSLRAGPGGTGGPDEEDSAVSDRKAGALGTTHGLASMVIRQRRQERRICTRDVQIDLFASPNQTQWIADVQKGTGDASAGVCYANSRADLWNTTAQPEPKTWPENLLGMTTQPFEVDYTKTDLPRMGPVNGLSGDRYNDDDEEFTMLLPYGELTEADLYQVIDSLKSQEWIDASTRVLIVQAVFYNPDESVFVTAMFVAEFLVAGELDSIARAHTLQYSTPQANAALAGSFALDLISSFFIFFAAIELFQAVQLNARVDNSGCPVGTWEVLTIMQLAMQIVAYAVRFVRWANGFGIPKALQGPALLTELESERLLQEVATELYAWMLFLSWMKVFSYLRYNQRLNALVEVVRLAIPELISMLIAGLMVNLPFAMLVHTIYGDEIEAVSSIQKSFWFLFRRLLETNMSDYDAMDPIAPFSTGLFYVVFFSINWFILLNMVLGVLASSFAAVQENVEAVSWDIASLVADTKSLVRMILHFGGGG
eukprot:Hpha_TRINITY_DN16002_c2_g5::TRINITY_DN16002_c2_g5_i1::g.122077::m.122077